MVPLMLCHIGGVRGLTNTCTIAALGGLTPSVMLSVLWSELSVV